MSDSEESGRDRDFRGSHFFLLTPEHLLDLVLGEDAIGMARGVRIARKECRTDGTRLATSLRVTEIDPPFTASVCIPRAPYPHPVSPRIE